MRFAKVPRLPRAPLWAVVLAVSWALLAGAGALADRLWGLGLQTCLFKQVTGHPCPTCGTSRGALALLSGHPLEAFLYNPLVFTGTAAIAAWLAFRAATGLEPRLEWTRPRRRAALSLFLAAVLANWAYLIHRGI